MSQMQPRFAGEVWKIEHARKGRLTIRLSKTWMPDDEWCQGTIVEGKAFMLSFGVKEPTVGDDITIRSTLFRWVELVSEGRPPARKEAHEEDDTARGSG